MHGELLRSRCESSSCIVPDFADETTYDSVQAIARCRCGARVRPHIVWFGEIPFCLDEIARELDRCDLFVTIGSSGVVYPAAGVAQRLSRGRGGKALYVGPRSPRTQGRSTSAVWEMQVKRYPRSSKRSVLFLPAEGGRPALAFVTHAAVGTPFAVTSAGATSEARKNAFLLRGALGKDTFMDRSSNVLSLTACMAVLGAIAACMPPDEPAAAPQTTTITSAPAVAPVPQSVIVQAQPAPAPVTTVTTTVANAPPPPPPVTTTTTTQQTTTSP
jgi:hypothetical protein